MKTFGDVHKEVERMRIKMAVFDAPPELKMELLFRAEEVVRVFRKENNLNGAMNIPDDAPLDTWSSEIFDSTVDWFRAHEPSWAPQEVLEVS